MCSVSRSWLILATLWTIVRQAPLSMGFSRHEYWSRLPGPPPGDLPDPGMEPTSPVSPTLQAGFLPLYHLGSHGAQGDRPKSGSCVWSQGRPRPAVRPFWEGKIPWRRAWLPTPEFLLEKSCGQRSLVDYGP